MNAISGRRTVTKENHHFSYSAEYADYHVYFALNENYPVCVLDEEIDKISELLKVSACRWNPQR